MPPNRTRKRKLSLTATFNSAVPTSSTSSNSSAPLSNADATRKIARPVNYWILFRKALANLLQALAISRGIELPAQRVLSSIISQVWGFLSEKDKEPFARIALEMKQVHQKRYPDYVFRPKRKTEEEKQLAKERKEKRVRNKEARDRRKLLHGPSRSGIVDERVALVVLPDPVPLSMDAACMSSRAISPPPLPQLESSHSITSSVAQGSAAYRLETRSCPMPSSGGGPMHNQVAQTGLYAGPSSWLSVPQIMMTHNQPPPASFYPHSRNDGYVDSNYSSTSESASSPPMYSASASDSEGEVGTLTTSAYADSFHAIPTATPIGIACGDDTFEFNTTAETWGGTNLSSLWESQFPQDANSVHGYQRQDPLLRDDGWYHNRHPNQNQNQNQGSQEFFAPSKWQLENMHTETSQYDRPHVLSAQTQLSTGIDHGGPPGASYPLHYASDSPVPEYYGNSNDYALFDTGILAPSEALDVTLARIGVPRLAFWGDSS